MLYHFGNHYSLLYTTCRGKEERSLSPTSRRERCARLSFLLSCQLSPSRRAPLPASALVWVRVIWGTVFKQQGGSI